MLEDPYLSYDIAVASYGEETLEQFRERIDHVKAAKTSRDTLRDQCRRDNKDFIGRSYEKLPNARRTRKGRIR